MEQLINGFTGEEIYDLYAFLNVYEQKKIKCLLDGDALAKYPTLSEIKKIISTFQTEEKTKSELKQIAGDSLNNEIYFTAYSSKMLGVLYHLRNSIAHAKISKEGNIVCIEDFDTNKTNPQHTAKGRLSFDILQKIINEMKNL